jgi:hypothetical protein
LPVTGASDGTEILSVVPIDNKIYDAVGNEASTTQSTNTDTLFDKAAPTILSLSSTASNGNMKIGDELPITITFNETVVLTGTPQITLETGTTDAVVNYTSGSNTTVLTFTYTVATGDTSSDLDYTGTTSLALNSGTIVDLSGNAAVLTLPAPGATNSLGANKALVVDGVVPTTPTGFAATDGNTSIILGWTANTESDIESYKIYADTSSSPVISLITIGSSMQSYTHSGLTNGKTYYYRISAMDAAGNESAKSSDISKAPKPQKYTVKIDSTGDFLSIQTCIEITADYDTVLVYPGTYVENISIDNQNIIVKSVYGADSTIINGNNTASCLSIVGGSNISFSGFSLRNGLGSNGGGIYIEGTETILLDKLHVFANLASNDGGGLYVNSANTGDVTLSNSKLYQNECVNKGGAVNIQDDYTLIEGTLIYLNSSQGDGGGIFTSGKLKMVNCTIASNSIPSGRYGAAMMVETGLDSSFLMNNIFYDAGDGIYKTNGKLVAYNNYFCEADVGLDIIRGSGNSFSDVDPFVDGDNFNYVLENTSDLIGSGIASTVFYGKTFNVPALDVYGTIRPNPAGSSPDLGAIENSLPSAIPTVVLLTSSTNDGTYKLGDVISIDVTFSEPVSKVNCGVPVTVTGSENVTSMEITSPNLYVPSFVEDVSNTTVGIADGRLFSIAPRSGLLPAGLGRMVP